MSDLSLLPEFTKGTLLAIAAAILFGAHTSYSRVRAHISMTIYKIYFLFGTSITCFIFTIIFVTGNKETVHFTYLGLIAAILLWWFDSFLLLSIQKIGIGYATGFTVFSALITAPIAQEILRQTVKYWYVMVCGLVILSFSVFIIALLHDILSYFGFLQEDDMEDDDDDNDDDNDDGESNYNFLLQGDVHQQRQIHLLAVIPSGRNIFTRGDTLPLFTPKPKKCCMNWSFNTVLGLIFSSLSGICMDLMPFPSLYADENTRGHKFFFSFGIGCIVMIPLCALMIIFDDKLQRKRSHSLCKLIKCDDKMWHFKHTKKVVIPAIIAGMIWSLGNICSFLSFLYLSYTTAIAYVQCQIIVALFCRVLLTETKERVQVISLVLLCCLYLAGCLVVIYGVHGMFPSLF